MTEVLEALGLPARVRRYPSSWGTMVIPRGPQHEGLLAVNWDGQGGQVQPAVAPLVQSAKPVEQSIEVTP